MQTATIKLSARSSSNKPEPTTSTLSRVDAGGNSSASQFSLSTDAGMLAASCPVILFSGFVHAEMMTVYNLLGQQIYEETGGQRVAACAKAVPIAMQKPLRQVLDEITGDHLDAISMIATESQE